MFLTFGEIFDIVLVSLAVAYIFKDYFERKSVIDFFFRKNSFFSEGFYRALIFVSPTIIFHELAHKFVAVSFGYNATVGAAYMWLFFGILMKILNFPFIIFAPAFVSISGNPTNVASLFISIAGPLSNLAMYYIGKLMYEKTKNSGWIGFSYLNIYLFFLNMLPIPGFDGFQALSALFRIIF
ncbi:MAG: hypothetical protein QXD62_01155 [Candidatus Woesearchaeota archaeon]